MTKVTYKKAPDDIGIAESRLRKFTRKPPDFTAAHWKLAKETAVEIGACMPQQMADSAFYFYYMGASWEEIANKLNIPLGMVLYTAVHFGWDSKKKLVNSVRAGEKVTRADAAAVDLVTDAIVATAAVYKLQIAEVIKDPTMAKSCPMIPKNYKDFMTLLQMLQSLQSDKVEASRPNGTSVNVNIANMPGKDSKTRTAQAVDVEALPTEEEDKDREELLKMLAKAKAKES